MITSYTQLTTCLQQALQGSVLGELAPQRTGSVCVTVSLPAVQPLLCPCALLQPSSCTSSPHVLPVCWTLGPGLCF